MLRLIGRSPVGAAERGEVIESELDVRKGSIVTTTSCQSISTT